MDNFDKINELTDKILDKSGAQEVRTDIKPFNKCHSKIFDGDGRQMPGEGHGNSTVEALEDLLDKFNREDNMIERIVCGIIELNDDLVEKYGFKNVKLEKDGDSFCVKLPDFKNLQESVAGFGNTIDEAIEDLYKNFTAENKKDRIEELENKVHGIECTMRETIEKEKQSDNKLMHDLHKERDINNRLRRELFFCDYKKESYENEISRLKDANREFRIQLDECEDNRMVILVMIVFFLCGAGLGYLMAVM
jgi:chromosome segregation ATPase